MLIRISTGGYKMTKDEVIDILGSAIRDDGTLYCCGTYISWNGKDLTLDGDFNLEYLEAIVWWMKNEKAKNV